MRSFGFLAHTQAWWFMRSFGYDDSWDDGADGGGS